MRFMRLPVQVTCTYCGPPLRQSSSLRKVIVSMRAWPYFFLFVGMNIEAGTAARQKQTLHACRPSHATSVRARMCVCVCVRARAWNTGTHEECTREPIHARCQPLRRALLKSGQASALICRHVQGLQQLLLQPRTGASARVRQAVPGTGQRKRFARVGRTPCRRRALRFCGLACGLHNRSLDAGEVVREAQQQ